jgi:hypothetical protein
MAGRRPQMSRDEQAGQDPLKRSPGWPNPNRSHDSAAQSRRAPGAAPKHGLFSARAVNAKSMSIITAMLEDARCPDHLRSPAFTAELMSWGRAEAMAALSWQWLCSVLDTAGPEAIFGMQPGMVKSLSDVWKGHEAFAAQRRRALGISPDGYARIARNLGLAAAATGDQLARMKEAGGEIARRRIGLVQGGNAG